MKLFSPPTMLPFSTSGSFNSIYKVNDEFGNSIEIPKYGSLSWAEYMSWVDYDNKKQAKEKSSDGQIQPMSEYMNDIVVAMLRLRFRVDKDITDAEVLTMEGGFSVPESLVRAIYEFFSQELVRWKPLISLPDNGEKKPLKAK